MSSLHVEEAEAALGTEVEIVQVHTMGTVKLTEGEIVYIPTPTADPQDPLNLPMWQKCVILGIISVFSTLGLSLVSGFGGLLGFYIPQYVAAGKDYNDITKLMTYPSLFMGIGNIIGMPLAIGVGRRVVFLASTVILVVGAALCAAGSSYEWQLGFRMVIGLAAGQSESVVPMVSQEIFFLHERSTAITVQLAFQAILTCIWVLFASPIAGAITPQWWYGLGAILSGVQLILTFFFLPETKYNRPLSSYQEGSSTEDSSAENPEGTSDKKEVPVYTSRPPLDYVNYKPRTWKSDLRLWIGSPDWAATWNVLRQTGELLLFPNVIWALLVNGLTLGTNVAIGTTYGTIITGAPYNWPNNSASYANIGQIVTALVALPLLGQGSDWLIKRMAKRNGGLHEPEVRLIPLIIPIIVGTFTAVLYGQGAAHPEKYHWFVYVWAVAAYYFAFVGANIAAVTYLLDSYPARAGPLLVIVCAFRGIISFGTSYGTAPFIASHGYDGTFGTFGALTAAMGLLGIPIYIWGKKIRHVTGRYARD
ncbi:uncharacterized protein BHQ10_008972 [Talaromyces amestolkiae]|uniref:Major facilitator superfamily (MFS) profile domain-containing protein n=1 Tax=Talaromyces amestolkiae TaxID=1196081 RepID=A0A364LAV9_TALAM|nr:uncharacterized protein BHQ10_008972 [Talaromyces amestolkiae]RAO72960.1 hypothetical protein BHQ10_008972 [Talaromyces amestolkiae]